MRGMLIDRGESRRHAWQGQGTRCRIYQTRHNQARQEQSHTQCLNFMETLYCLAGTEIGPVCAASNNSVRCEASSITSRIMAMAGPLTLPTVDNTAETWKVVFGVSRPESKK